MHHPLARSSCFITSSLTYAIKRRLSLLPCRLSTPIIFRKMNHLVCNHSCKNGYSTVEDEYRKAIKALNSLQSNRRAQHVAKKDEPRNLSTVLTHLDNCRSCGMDSQAIERLSVIHVAGTKGKGSTCAYCESILRQYNYKTGFFSSPHLCSVRERIRINGDPISKEKFTEYFWCLFKTLEQNKKSDESMPTYFMFLTLMSFKVFLDEKVDVAIIEVGIGGEYDFTNVLKNTAVVGISSLGYDHVKILGNTIEEIAWQKAGIIKSTSVVVTASDQSKAALQVLQKRAVEKGRTLYIAPDLNEYEYEKEIVLGIKGPVQRLNASLALQLSNAWLNPRHYSQDTEEVREAAPFSLSSEMSNGLQKCSWPGRAQILQYSPQLSYFLDGAHTDESLQNCLEWFEQTVAPCCGIKKVLMFNLIGDRDPKKLLRLFLPYRFDLVCFTTNRIENSRGEIDVSKDNWAPPSEKEERRAEENYDHWMVLNPTADKQNTRLLSNVKEGHDLLAKLSLNDRLLVLVTGSLHLVGAFLSVLTPNND